MSVHGAYCEMNDCSFLFVYLQKLFVNKSLCVPSCLIPPAYDLTQLLPLRSPPQRVCQTDI